jgi:uncharacterized protein YoxC
MCLTLPEDKKTQLKKELIPVEEKLSLVATFGNTVSKVREFCQDLQAFNASLKSVDTWMSGATRELEDIKSCVDKLTPEDRVSRTMDLQEDIAAKVHIIKNLVSEELQLLPQGKKIKYKYRGLPKNFWFHLYINYCIFYIKRGI